MYDVYLDEDNERVLELRMTVLCATQGGPASLREALTSREHVAFETVYRFSDQDEVEAFDVPREVVRLLR